MRSLGSEIKFTELCKLFEKLVTLKGLRKFEALKNFTKNCRELAHQIKSQNADTSLFPIYRLLLPSLERDRGPYGLKTKNLSLLYVRVFCLGKNSSNAEKLTNFRKPVNGTETSKYDDLAGRIYWVLKNRLQNEGGLLTVDQVNDFLDDVATYNEMNKSKDELFVQFTRNISALELKWLTRILLKDLKLGLVKKKVFEAIHPNAEELFNKTSNLRKVCKNYSDLQSNEANTSIDIEVFSHVKPMLLERFQIEHISKLFNDDQKHYYIQTKFDGERSQLHMKNGVFKYFTRQGYDNTNKPSYGQTVDSGGFLTSNLAPLLNKDCRSIILDGELMGWHKERKCFGAQGMNYDIKKVTEKSNYQPCFVAYDILLYNDESLMNKPYSERLDVLKSVFTEKEGVLMHCNTRTVSKVGQLMELFNIALDNNDEGIVVKRPDCIYQPNVREKSGCYKIKAEYSDHLVQDLDMIILGGYYGQGRCSGQLSVFLVGIANPPTNRNGLPSEFFSIVQVKSGLSDKDLKGIQQKLRSHWREKKPNGIIGPKVKAELPDVWITPKQSIILQLRATEIIRTGNYPFGYSLRFPRVLKVRYDKSWFDTCSTTEFENLIKDKGAIQKLTKRKVTANDINDAEENEVPKLRKTAPATSKVYDNFVPMRNSDEVTRVSRLFEGKEFRVINGDAKLKKSDVEKLLLEHSAKIVENPGDETFCVLVGNPDALKARNLINGEKYDVANLDWLRRATRQENFAKIVDFHPWELYSASSKTKRKLKENYNEFMDNYYEDTDWESFKRTIKKAKLMVKKNPDFSQVDMKMLDKILFVNGVSPFSIFRGVVAYFINPNDSQKYYFAFMSGQTLEVPSSSADYIFVDNIDSTDFLQEFIKELENSESEKPIKIVNSQWINDCFKERKLLPIHDYVA